MWYWHSRSPEEVIHWLTCSFDILHVDSHVVGITITLGEYMHYSPMINSNYFGDHLTSLSSTTMIRTSLVLGEKIAANSYLLNTKFSSANISMLCILMLAVPKCRIRELLVSCSQDIFNPWVKCSQLRTSSRPFDHYSGLIIQCITYTKQKNIISLKTI